MAFTKREYTKGEIDRAGRDMITLRKDDPARENAIAIVDNWRACHAYPLQIIKTTLLNRAKRIDPKAFIAQRLKRRPSIEIKLLQNPTMKLSQMQDIAGCRAVLTGIDKVKELKALYEGSHAKSRKGRSLWDGSNDFDYISHPKTDGYRSLHLIFRYEGSGPQQKVYNGQRIEIQIRSKLQHLWATAVETAQVFTGQALKSRIKNASTDWLRFFALASSVFARKEKCPIVPGTPNNNKELFDELRLIAKREKIMESLWGWSTTIHLREEHGGKTADSFLLVLDPSNYRLSITPFEKEQILEAQEQYQLMEKETENDPNKQVVLVSVESMDALRKAYPNYYADTREFIGALEKVMGKTIIVEKSN